MNNLSLLGRIIFALPLIGFGLSHFANAEQMSAIVPKYMPMPSIWVYLTGAALILSAISILTGIMMRLACVLLAVMLLIFVLLIHLPLVQAGGVSAQLGIPNLLKDLAMAGGALVIASRDR